MYPQCLKEAGGGNQVAKCLERGGVRNFVFLGGVSPLGGSILAGGGLEISPLYSHLSFHLPFQNKGGGDGGDLHTFFGNFFFDVLIC